MSYFNRAYSLLIGETGAQGLLLDTNPSDTERLATPLHIEFTIDKSDKTGEKNKASFTLYNLSDSSISRISKDNKVIFQAGYEEDSLRTLFIGQVEDVSTINMGATVRTTVKCVDGYIPVREGFTAATYSKGSTVQTILNTIITKDLGLPNPRFNNGSLGDKGLNKVYQGGSAKIGNSAAVVSKLCQDNFLTWTIRDGVAHIYPVDGSTSIVVPLISAESGMIGSPQKTQDNKSKLAGSKDLKTAYKVRVLLDGGYNIGDLVEVDSDFTSGRYRITGAKHTGSYEGGNWFTDLVLGEGVR